MKKILLLVVSFFFITTVAYADSQDALYNNAKALKGLTASQAYFDITIGNPKQLLVRLQLIEKTYNQFVAAGITPDFIVGIRSKASNFFTKGNDYIVESDLPEKQQIATMVKKLSGLKIGLEQCHIAAGFQDIDVADFLPEIEIVANGYVSMIGYHSQGYGLVPMD